MDERAATNKNETPADKAVRRTAVATIWMAIFTCVLAVTSGLTIWILKNQLKEMHEGGTDTHTLAQAADTQAKRMTDVSTAADKIRQAAENMVVQDQRIADNAKKALEASNRQSKAALDASIASSREDQRAWLGAGDETYSIPESGPIESTVTVGNTGKSPAIDVFCRIMGITKPRAYILSDSDIIYSPELPVLKEGTLFPNQHFPLKAGGNPMDPADQKIWFQNIQSGDWVEYFFGDVRYKDTFGKEHWTHFCSRFVSSTKTGTPCSVYNDTDDN
jgi:hypothetical protein